MDLGLTNKIALVTGGSKGLGKAIAMELAAEGARLAICSRSQAEIDAAADDIRAAHGAQVLASQTDVTQPRQITAFVERVIAEYGRVDILVNNAGRAQPGTFETLTDEQWLGDIQVKLFGMIRMCRAVAPHLPRDGSGRIININAIVGRQSQPGLMATTTNRGSCLAFTKALSDELAQHHILVNSINIGYVLTPQWENVRARLAPQQSLDQFIDEFCADSIPLRRVGQPEEVAAVVAFVASKRAGYLTGASIDVGGGLGRYI